MRTLVVGDVHGCADELRALLATARADRVVLVGDLFTKGPDPAGVWTQVRDGGFAAVLGNHDARLLRSLGGRRPDDAEAAACVAALDTAGLGWRPWLAALPIVRRAAGFVVVHAGLHPTGRLEDTTRRMALTMRRWPMQEDAPPWHAVYRGDRRVIFGHDARGGLVRVERNGRPWLIGLDTGCVYGNALSGYLVEEDRVLHVPAARVYRPIRSGSESQPSASSAAGR